MGDAIQFLRYARMLRERGARVVLAVQAVLGRLLTAHPDVDELFILGSARELPLCDFYLPLLSAPGAFAHDRRDDSPRGSLPLGRSRVDRQVATGTGGNRRLQDRHRLARLARVCMDRWRSIPLAQFAAAGPTAGRAAGQPAKRIWIGAGGHGRFSGARPFRPARRSGRSFHGHRGRDPQSRPGDHRRTRRSPIWPEPWAHRFGWRSVRRPIGVGCSIATTRPGIPRCGSSARPRSASGQTFSAHRRCRPGTPLANDIIHGGAAAAQIPAAGHPPLKWSRVSDRGPGQHRMTTASPPQADPPSWKLSLPWLV